MTPDATSFEANYAEIDKVVERLRSRWTFKASIMRDFEDVKSEILTHIWKKWSQYDQTRALGGWVAIIAKHQFANLLRDIYLSTSSPCSKCKCNLGGDVCSIYGVISNMDCALFQKWHSTKRLSHEARLPLSLENHLDEAHTYPDSSVNLETAAAGLHEKMKETLTKSEWEIYRRLFVEHKEEDVVARELGFKMTERGKKIGYKRIRQVKILILQKAKEVMAEHGMEGLR